MLVLHAFGRDLIHALRSLAKARAFTFVCVASLGVGIGTVMAILMLLRAIVGTPPGVNDDGFVELLVRPQGQLLAQTGRNIETWSYPDFADLAGAETGMSLTAWTFGDTILRTGEADEPRRVPVMYVSTNYFPTIGARLALGAGFTTARDAASPPVVIINHHFWQTRLGGRPDVVGATVTLNHVVHAVVGVAPELFRGHLSPEGSPDVQIWAPLDQHPRLQGVANLRHQRDVDWLRLIGRLQPGASLVQANAAVPSSLPISRSHIRKPTSSSPAWSSRTIRSAH